MRPGLVCCLVVAVLGFGPVRAGDSPMQACTAQWQRLGLSREAYRPFLVRCLKGEVPVPAPVVKPRALAVRTSAAKSVKSQGNRMKLCGARWQQMKADGTTGGQTWRQFSAACLRKS